MDTLETNFVRILLEKGRLPEMPQSSPSTKCWRRKRKIRLRVRVKSAFPLSPALQEEVRQRFAQYTSKDIVIDQEIPHLSAALWPKWGAWCWMAPSAVSCCASRRHWSGITEGD